MSKLVIIGGTGYAGSHIAAEAAGRGHEVTVVSRSAPAAPVEGIRYRQGSAQQTAGALVGEADVAVLALSPRGDTAGQILGVYSDLARVAAEAGTRLVIIGGFSSLRPAADGPRVVEDGVDPRFAAEAREMDSVRAWLQSSAPDGLDWLFVSPAALFGAYAPGETTGSYRVSGEVALLDAQGHSEISGTDFALAVIGEIERHEHSGHIGLTH